MNHAEFMKRFDVYPEVERYAIEHAYILSKDAHRSQERKDGERYFEHPRRAALILIEEVGVSSWEDICAVLLHDTVEDTKYITVPKLRHWFNSMVADLVDYMTKRPGRPQREYYGKLSEMDRAVLIKGCDRLDNVRSLVHCDDEFIRKQVHGTKKFVLPLLQVIATKKDDWISSKAQILFELIEKEIEKIQAVVADRNQLEPCLGVSGFGCIYKQQKKKRHMFCDKCAEDYNEDPESYK
jgi:(p)ppGpp synthase/HD superfamily hydrolase